MRLFSPVEKRSVIIVSAALPMCIPAADFFSAAAAAGLFAISILAGGAAIWAGRRIWPRAGEWAMAAFILSVILKALSIAAGIFPEPLPVAPLALAAPVMVSGFLWTGFALMRTSSPGDRLHTLIAIVALVLACGISRQFFFPSLLGCPGVFLFLAVFIFSYAYLMPNRNRS